MVHRLCLISKRRSEGVNLGHGGKPRLERAIRAHANFAEYVPFVVMLMGIAELNDTASCRVHLLGGLLLAGRVSHAYCFVLTEGHLPTRFAGTLFTFAALIMGTMQCLQTALF